jgi:hypothetical protein
VDTQNYTTEPADASGAGGTGYPIEVVGAPISTFGIKRGFCQMTMVTEPPRRKLRGG